MNLLLLTLYGRETGLRMRNFRVAMRNFVVPMRNFALYVCGISKHTYTEFSIFGLTIAILSNIIHLGGENVAHNNTIYCNITKTTNCTDQTHIGEHFEIDALMEEIIAELNRKGFKTKFSCCGRITRLNTNSLCAYIALETDVVFSPPVGFVRKYDKMRKLLFINAKPLSKPLYYSLSKSDRKLYRQKQMDVLLNWAKKLPERITNEEVSG